MAQPATNNTEIRKDAGRDSRPVMRRAASPSRGAQRGTKGKARRGHMAKVKGAPRPKGARTQSRPRTQERRCAAARNARALNGFGGIAILGVIGYHLGIPFLAGGHLGFVMLLVLASYLLTSVQLGKIRMGIRRLPRQWIQVIASIWPPLAIVTACTVVFSMALAPDLLPAASADVLPGLTLVENLSYILRGIAPSGGLAGGSPLAHLWYLSIYAQFCITWPLAMLIGYAVLPSRTAARRVTLVLAAVSAAGMALLYGSGAGAVRAFYGTDTRLFAPLLGAWLAYAMPMGKRPARDLRGIAKRGRLAIEIAGILALVGLVACMAVLGDSAPALYRGGMFAAALLATIVIAALALPGGILTTALGIRPLQWLGSRSLGIYLWHYPLLRMLGASVAEGTWPAIAIALALTLVLAELSHRLVGSISQLRTDREPADGTLASLGRKPVAVASPILAAIVAVAVCAFTGNVGLADVFPTGADAPQQATAPGAQEEDNSEQPATDAEDSQETASTDDGGANESADQQAAATEAESDKDPQQNGEQPEKDDAQATNDASAQDQPADAQDEEKEQDKQFEEVPGLPRVLIIGNSFTFFNDLPSLLAADLGTKVYSETKESAHLSEHLNGETEQGASTLARLDDGHWDYVVIQEMSSMPIDDKDQYLQDLSTLVDLIRERGAEPIIYGTWAYDTGRWGAAARGMTVQEMHDALQASFQEASELTGAPIANVGQAFADAGFDASLYDEDGKHPSLKGSQLAADIIAEVVMADWESEA